MLQKQKEYEELATLKEPKVLKKSHMMLIERFLSEFETKKEDNFLEKIGKDLHLDIQLIIGIIAFATQRFEMQEFVDLIYFMLKI